ncbi:hypothetical protein G3580_01325 [Nitrogeniibacter mangrovi]|uniref:Uncharacterized protein n=1 Tax=Nitrogeniibacter mangrovi TaxID=2016596 RepID=A0A6C1AYH6_9RHOO|nr:hypothetical protein [Nitrogeniibacter mangrovi]QID16387.1 hypothetical protein G3580_01325 [Nitrogeniibacter mangrovi]
MRDFVSWVLGSTVGKFTLLAVIAVPMVAIIGYFVVLARREDKRDRR